MTATAPRVLVIACGALAVELAAVVGQLEGIDVDHLPPDLHDRPERIPTLVRERIRAARARYDTVVVGYADCGTGGRLDAVCEQEGVERLPGAHCYELLAGAQRFAALHDREPGTFYLTDFLARRFDRLVVRGLGLDRYPELAGTYFAHYRRLVHLTRTAHPAVVEAGRAAARRLGLEHELVRIDDGHLRAALALAIDRLAPQAAGAAR